MTPSTGFQFGRAATIAAIAVALVGSAAEAGAQQYPLSAPQGTSVKPQRGTSPKPRVEEPDPRYPSNPLYSPTPIGFTYIPAIMMSDGSVWANFGHGYVQVHTACARPGRVIDGRGTSTSATKRREQRDGYCYTRTEQGSLVVTR